MWEDTVYGYVCLGDGGVPEVTFESALQTAYMKVHTVICDVLHACLALYEKHRAQGACVGELVE